MRFSTFVLPYFLLSLLVVACLAGCNTDATPPPPLGVGSFSNVASIPATSIETLNSNGTLLLAGTDHGAYKKRLDDSEAGWVQAGLDIDSAKVVDFVIWNEQEFLAAIGNDNPRGGRPVLFKSQDGGNNWNALTVQYDEEELRFFAVRNLLVDHSNSNQLYANTGYISESSDSGSTWNNIYAGQISEFLTISTSNSDIIWTGGLNNIFSPYLAKSEDGGDTWMMLNENFFFNSDATVYDLVVHPDNSDRVLAGVGGSVSPANVIRLSTDGGQNWETVYEGVNTRTLAHSALGNGRVYASGRNADGSLFFVASTDFGDTWEMVQMEGEPLLVQINDMVSVMENGKEVLYLGTNKGVYSYTFEE